MTKTKEEQFEDAAAERENVTFTVTLSDGAILFECLKASSITALVADVPDEMRAAIQARGYALAQNVLKTMAPVARNMCAEFGLEDMTRKGGFQDADAKD